MAGMWASLGGSCMPIGAKETTMYQYSKRVRRELVAESAAVALGVRKHFPWPWEPEAVGLAAAHRVMTEAFKRLSPYALRTLMR